ncbi:PAS domain-containing sensor histidine kinase [Cesiribacter andamanensis]|uniref:histidine kinase n=1 Tax=Cesiribacter andamanensis AMV16 TaxID=1279009 RepID=M7NAG2_9BACT|nr:ATP-binding protein [Cesiribacter andamanensis]EMR04242.1 Sensor protein CreC [Cesiribacter andamanensis AMV16]
MNYPEIIAANVPIFFFVYELPSQRIVYVSEKFFEMAEKGRNSDSDASRFHQYIHPEDQPRLEQFFRDLHEENNYISRVELRTNETVEQIDWLEVKTYPVEENGEEVRLLVGHITDITERKNRLRMLKESANSKDNIINILTHDLRAPFHQIQIITDLLRKEMSPEEQQKHKRYLDVLLTIGKQSDGLIQRLMHLSRLQERSLHPEMRLHDMRQLVRETSLQFDALLQRHALEVHFEQPDFAVEAEVDQVLLRQALGNLLNNAIKYTPEGGSITFTTGYTKAHDHIELRLRDTGIGIPEEKLQQLLKNPSAAKRTGLKGEKSTGLGLLICQQILQLHRGQLAVESQQEKGTTFIITLPMPNPQHN